MSRTSMVIATVFGLGFVFGVAVGGSGVTTGNWAKAAAGYGIAALCVLGALREVGRSKLPGDYTDDEDQETVMVGDAYDPDQPRTRRMGRLRAARAARREVRDMPCGCERYWSTAGIAHDPWCYRYEGSGQ